MPVSPAAAAPVLSRNGSPRNRGHVRPDALTQRALASIQQAPPHARLLALAGCTLSEFATRLEPPASRSRLRAVLEQAELRGRLTRPWAERLGQVVEASADDVLALFGITTPAVRGRPRRRPAAAAGAAPAPEPSAAGGAWPDRERGPA